MSFENAWYLLLFAPVAAAAGWLALRQFRRTERPPAIRMPDLGLAGDVPAGARAHASRWLWVARIAALALLVVALARPRRGLETVHDTTLGVDMALCIDVSGSMRAQDLAEGGESRLDVAKRVAADFVDRRGHDRLALIPFAKHAYRLCPLTLHHDWLKSQLGRLRIYVPDERTLPGRGSDADGSVLIDGSSTAIGTALALATSALRASKAKSKVAILLTDGNNNFGRLEPQEAAGIAKDMGVRVYAVGAGRVQEQQTFFGVRRFDPIDEDTLREVAAKTGGRYFRAEDEEALKRVYAEIDSLEKTKIESYVHTRYDERFAGLAVPAAVLVWIEVAAAWMFLRRSP